MGIRIFREVPVIRAKFNGGLLKISVIFFVSDLFIEMA